jgi:hypothetical protein
MKAQELWNSDGPHAVKTNAEMRWQGGGMRAFVSPARPLALRTSGCGRSGVEREAHFNRDLPVFHSVLVNVAAHFGHLKPAQPMKRGAGAFEGVVNGFLDGGGGGAGQFDDFVDMIVHNSSNIRALAPAANFWQPHDWRGRKDNRGLTQWERTGGVAVAPR